MSVRTERVTVRMSPSERAELTRRASAHGMPAAAFLRTSALTGSSAADDSPDAWWDTLPAGRKAQVMRWLTERAQGRPAQDEVLLDVAP